MLLLTDNKEKAEEQTEDLVTGHVRLAALEILESHRTVKIYQIIYSMIKDQRYGQQHRAK